MALVLGTNCGFVTVAPTTDPSDGAKIMDAVTWGIRDTTPAILTKITEVGWYCDNATATNANFEVGLYSHDAVNNCPGALLFSDIVNEKGTTAGWKTVTVDWDIVPETIYWIAVQLDNTSSQTNTNYTGGAQGSLGPSGAALQNPWGSTDSREEFCAFYAVVGAGVSYIELVGAIAGTSSLSGILTTELYVDISGTITGVSTLSGTIILSSNWQTVNFHTPQRLVVAGSDSIWYEDI